MLIHGCAVISALDSKTARLAHIQLFVHSCKLVISTSMRSSNSLISLKYYVILGFTTRRWQTQIEIALGTFGVEPWCNCSINITPMEPLLPSSRLQDSYNYLMVWPSTLTASLQLFDSDPQSSTYFAPREERSTYLACIVYVILLCPITHT